MDGQGSDEEEEEEAEKRREVGCCLVRVDGCVRLRGVSGTGRKGGSSLGEDGAVVSGEGRGKWWYVVSRTGSIVNDGERRRWTGHKQ